MKAKVHLFRAPKWRAVMLKLPRALDRKRKRYRPLEFSWESKSNSICVWFAAQGWSFGRAIFFLCLIFFVDWLIWRDDPVEAMSFTQASLDEAGIAGNDGQSCAKKVLSVAGIGFLRFTTLDLLDHLRETNIGILEANKRGIVLLEQT